MLNTFNHLAARSRIARRVLGRSFRSCILTGLLLAPLQALAGEAYPSRPIKLVVPFGPGTTTDLLARQLAEDMFDELGQRLVIENKGGAGGTIGSETVARSAPDGYVLLFGTGQTHAVNVSMYRSLRYDPIKDFTPIARLASQPLVLVATPGLGVASLPELLAKAAERPEDMIFASTGVGSSPHLAAAAFAKEAKIPITHVRYANGQALPDLLSGRTKLMFYPYLPLKSFIEARQVVPLATTGLERLPELPALPTMRETGYPDLVVAPWYGLYGPAGLPAAVRQKLENAVRGTLQRASFAQRIQDTGTRLAFLPGEGLAQFTAAEIVRSREFVLAAGATQ